MKTVWVRVSHRPQARQAATSLRRAPRSAQAAAWGCTDVVTCRGADDAALVEAVRIRDYTVVQGLVLLGGLLVVSLNLMADGANYFLDPRTRRA